MKRKAATKRSQPTKRPEKAIPASSVPVRTALFGGAALLILFAWLHLILALQIASTGRQIQITTEELQRLKRENMAVARDIAIAESEEKMTKRATAMGYGPQAPVYLLVGQTFVTTGPAAGSSQSRSLVHFLLDSTLYDPTVAQREAAGSEIGFDRRAP
ncbi:MAG: hypothetical protein JXM73_02870 [Anaerolineae bacterium]|nr:hypothetical protein [Anaerolineae bacterium]